MTTETIKEHGVEYMLNASTTNEPNWLCCYHYRGLAVGIGRGATPDAARETAKLRAREKAELVLGPPRLPQRIIRHPLPHTH